MKKLAKQGTIRRDELTVAYITGHGLKTQEAVMGTVGDVVRIQPSLSSFEQMFQLPRDAAGGEPASDNRSAS
jgi:threonine synthase